MEKATIWNPNTAEKKVIDVGEPMPTGFKLWTGGTATGTEAQAAIKKATTPKLPTITNNTIPSSDISNGMNNAGITPPPKTADVVHQTFVDNANQFTQQQQDMMKIYDTQQKEAKVKIDEANKKQAENQTAIDKNAAEIKTTETADLNNPDVQGWRQKALGITAEDLTKQYETKKTLLDQNLQYGEEIKTLSAKMQNEITGNKNIPALASVMSGRENTIKEDYAGRIGVLQAGIAVNNNNFSLAQSFIDDAISTVNADRTDRLNYLKFYKGLLDQKSSDNKTALLTATADEKKAIDSEITILTDKIKETETNKTTIMKLLTDTQTSQMAIKAGVNVTDTMEQAVKKMTDYVKANPNEFNSGNYEIQKDAFGNVISIFDKKRGVFVNPSDPLYQVANTGSGQGGMRTDRHNNPTAMTIDVAKSLGLVEGKDYTKGDPFTSEDGKTYYTARLLGDGVQTTISALDNAANNNSTQAFFTSSGKPRWTYISMTDQQWLSLSPDQKKQVVARMYQQEGGDGSIFASLKGNTPGTNNALEEAVNNSLKSRDYYETLDKNQQKLVADEILKRGQQIPPKEAKPATADQSNAAIYAMRIKDSMAIFDKFETDNPKSGFWGAVSSYMPDWAITNWLKTSDFQQFEQAERNFINAVLRRESGAVISPQEFDNAKKQYFPQPGDSAEVLKQKKQNRDTALVGISKAAGPALSSDFSNSPSSDDILNKYGLK